MEILKKERARVAWDGWRLASWLEMEAKEEGYDIPDNILAYRLELSGRDEGVFSDIPTFGAWCAARGVDVGGAFRADLEAAVRVFFTFLGHGVLITKGGLMDEVLSLHGREPAGLYPALTERSVQWAVVRFAPPDVSVERFSLSLPELALTETREDLP
ncbi:hypothetical protein ACN47A_18765 [Myxococcus fulvus]|uniref:hypothetical protein n=1 Tax=Myxococcus fulvus TaxID=33 RepID=UPI003B9C42CA